MGEHPVVRVAVFTNEFPSRSGTFFGRDMRGLLACGMQVEVFPTRPIDARRWRYETELLDHVAFSKHNAHHVSPFSLGLLSTKQVHEPIANIRTEVRQIIADSRRRGSVPLAKTVYACLQGAAWLKRDSSPFDVAFSYWGNHPGTTAFLASRFAEQPLPLVLGLQAHDLFYNRVHFRRKIQHAARIVVSSQYSRDYLLGLHPELRGEIAAKTEIIPAGLDLNEFAFQPLNRPSMHR